MWMRTRRGFVWYVIGCAGLVIGSLPPQVLRADDAGPPVAVEKAAGRTGDFHVKLSTRSRLSQPEEIAGRASVKPAPGEGDYDLARERFEIYVPKSPGPDGKYGVVDVMPFAGHSFPPHGWEAVLEKHHLIWIADPEAGGSMPPVHRIGVMLDAAYNVQKTWPVDPRRVYTLITTPAPTASGVGLYYPDVFQGSIFVNQWPWWAKVSDPRVRNRFDTDKIARPQPEQLGPDRSRSRFVGVTSEEHLPPNAIVPGDLVYKQGWAQAGFSHLKWIKVPHEELSTYSTYSPEWFDRALDFLDESLPASQTALGHEPPARDSAQPASGEKSASDPAAEASHALSLAKSYIAAQRYDAARTRLNHIIQTYPGTAAAKQAQSLLKEIQGK